MGRTTSSASSGAGSVGAQDLEASTSGGLPGKSKMKERFAGFRKALAWNRAKASDGAEASDADAELDAPGHVSTEALVALGLGACALTGYIRAVLFANLNRLQSTGTEGLRW